MSNTFRHHMPAAAGSASAVPVQIPTNEIVVHKPTGLSRGAEFVRSSPQGTSPWAWEFESFPSARFPLNSPLSRSRGFTLLEMLVVIAIIGMLAGLGLAAMFKAQESARASHTRAVITKLNSQMAQKWESYRTRRLPMTFDTAAGGTDTRPAALAQLLARRQLMRIELPDRWEDITYLNLSPVQNNHFELSGKRSGWDSVLPKTEFQRLGVPLLSGTINLLPSALSLAYQRRYSQFSPVPTADYQGAECLYLIMTTGMGEDGDVDVVFSPKDVGDFDKDGALEFIDGWGNPISCLRWAPGFASDLQPGRPKSGDDANGIDGDPWVGRDANLNHDPFDPRKIDPFAFEMFPLIYSYGPDGEPGLVSGGGKDFNDPYGPLKDGPQRWRGEAIEPSKTIQYGGGSADDNIHNHMLDLRK